MNLNLKELKKSEPNPNKKKCVRDRIRTCNLLIRSQTPYPLGHADSHVSKSTLTLLYYYLY